MRGQLRLALAATFSGRADAILPMTTRADGRCRRADLALQGARSAARTDHWNRRPREHDDRRAGARRIPRRHVLGAPADAAAAVGDHPELQSGWSVAGVYLKLGVEHILLGVDHLLFVLALLIIARGTWLLVKTVTAFTVAHSITLALATLGYVHVPLAPVEALIALEHRLRRGRDRASAAGARWFDGASAVDRGFRVRPSARSRLCRRIERGGASRRPYSAGAAVLQHRGRDRPVAVHCRDAVRFAMIRRMRPAAPRWAGSAAPYAVGSIAMFWVIERVAAF